MPNIVPKILSLVKHRVKHYVNDCAQNPVKHDFKDRAKDRVKHDFKDRVKERVKDHTKDRTKDRAKDRACFHPTFNNCHRMPTETPPRMG